MKKLIPLILALMLMLPCLSALAEPRYPANVGVTTDAAAVLSRATTDDLRTFNDRLSKLDGLNLYVATVDFLDGMAGQTYVNNLFQRWSLNNDDVLLLMAVGEDSYFFDMGSSVRVSDSVLTKLLVTHFETPFLAQRYDDAIAALIPVFAEEAGKAYSKDVSAAGLFGTEAASAPATAAWWENTFNTNHGSAATIDVERIFDEASERTGKREGISMGTIFVVVFLVWFIFGRKNRRRRKGRVTFGTVVAGFGLFSILRKLFRNR